MHYTIVLSSSESAKSAEGIRLFLPMFTNSSFLLGSPLMTAFSSILALELFILLLSTVINCTLIAALRSSSLIHINLKLICIAHLMEFFVLALSQVILICYQAGVITVTGRMSNDVLLLTAGVIKVHFFWSTILVQMAIVLERTIATKYISKYEMMKSKQVGIIICIAKWLLSMFIALVFLYLRMTYYSGSLLVAFVLGTTLTWYVILLRYNRKVLAGCSVAMYTLSSKYQCTENIRILTLVRNMFILTGGSITILLFAMFSLRRSDNFMLIQPFMVVLLELVISAFPLELLVIVLWDSQQRIRIANRLEQRTRQRLYSAVDYNLWDSAQESLIYFKQLNNSWSKQRQ